MAILAAFDIFILKSSSKYSSKGKETGDHCSRRGKSPVCSLALLHDKKESNAMITSRCINSCDALQISCKLENYYSQETLFDCKAWQINNNSNNFISYCDITHMDQGEPGLDYNDSNLNPLVCDICNKSFDSLDKLGEHQKKEHDM
jgi:C2H2-type zinc finger